MDGGGEHRVGAADPEVRPDAGVQEHGARRGAGPDLGGGQSEPIYRELASTIQENQHCVISLAVVFFLVLMVYFVMIILKN